MQNYWNLRLACKQQQLYGPVNYRDFRDTGPWALKASLKTSVLAASKIDSGSSFHSWEKSFFFIYIGPATSIYKFKWVVISCLAFLLFKVIWNFYCRVPVTILYKFVNLVCFLLCSSDGHFSSSSKLATVPGVRWVHFLTKRARGEYFRNFWVGMCRWDPGTLNLYQS